MCQPYSEAIVSKYLTECKIKQEISVILIFIVNFRAKVIIHTINGLRADRKYAIQVVASIKGNGVPYNILFADTNVCNKE